MNGSSRGRILLFLSPLLLLALLLHFLSPNSKTTSSYGGGRSLPGFASRSQFAKTRRNDNFLRSLKKQRTAAALSHGGTGGIGPANFSEPPPFTFCPTFGPQDELGNVYGQNSIMKTRAHVGSSDRIKKVIKRAMAGLPITIGVLGGSVSSCHGIDATMAHPLGNPTGPNCYPGRLFDWLNDVFPHPANELTNGALRRTGTSYFGFCSEMHLPDRVDLVILEFDTEDPNDTTTLATTDLLVRSLLLRPDQPAIIMLGHFAPQIQGQVGFAGPEVWHAAVAQFYDVVHLSVKGLLYEEFLMNNAKVYEAYYIDPILPNSRGHELLADTVIAYLEAEICSVWDAAALETDIALYSGRAPGSLANDDLPSLLSGKGLRKAADAGLDAEDFDISQLGRTTGSRSAFFGIPAFRINDMPHTYPHFREIKPNCASANDLINPLPQSVFAGSGWNPVAPAPGDEEERHYWFTDSPMSLLKIPIKCGAGDIAIYYLKAPASQGVGNVLCWVDDNTEGAVELRGSWDETYPQPTVTQIDQGVSPGPHYVVCELQGRSGIDAANFTIFGVFAT